MSSSILDRITPPEARSFRPVPLPSFEQTALSNGIPVYFLPCGTQDVTGLEVVFRAGGHYDPVYLRPSYAMRNLAEGAGSRTSEQLAQFFDGHGAYLSHDAEGPYTALSLAGLTSKFGELLPVFAEVWLDPLFPEEEFEEMKKRDLHRLEVNQLKTSWNAQRAFSEAMYGHDHVYGHHTTAEEIQSIAHTDLREFHRSFLTPVNASLLVVGRFDREEMFSLLDQQFGGLNPGVIPTLNDRSEEPLAPAGRGRILAPVEGVQSSLRLGHRTIERSHPDFYGLSVATTLFGGYFGSRLMHTIREEKGYTYGIHAGLRPKKHAGHLFIQADVANHFVDPTIEAVRQEMELLIREGTNAEELNVVRQVMLGRSLDDRETPWQLGETLRSSIVNGISFEEMDRRFSVIASITPEEVQQLAKTYFQPENLLEVVAGNPASAQDLG